MLRPLIRSRLKVDERRLGGSLEYLRHILRVSLRSFFKFIRIVPLAKYRRTLPPGPYHVARIVATRDEDCGTCVQMAVNLAKQDGVATAHLRSVLDRKPENLPDDLADAYRFAEGVVTASGAENDLRQKIRERHGEEALVELAFAIAACRVFPITKRALGYAVSCSDVQIEGLEESQNAKS